MNLRLAMCGLALAGCGSRVPHPPYTTQPTNALVEVDYPPPPARVEFVTEQPAKNTVWLNGEWSWTGRRWSWKQGGWVVVPEGATYAKVTVVRRSDGKLFFAPGAWRNAKGEEVQAPAFKVASASKSTAVVDPEGDPAPTAADQPTDGGVDARVAAPDQPEERPQKPKEEERTP